MSTSIPPKHLPLVLASSSPFRRQLLSKLEIEFAHCAPDIDETALPEETPEELVNRLAKAKANAVAKHYPKALIIGSDQVATIGKSVLTKPLNHENAVAQLRRSSDQKVTFLTSLCLLNSHTGNYQLATVPCDVQFLPLSEKQIEVYLKKEQPYQCAGSFKSEGLGITLFSSIKTQDPDSLVGLPLIALTAMLRKEGLEPLS